jgi:cytoskeletal protein RodZ
MSKAQQMKANGQLLKEIRTDKGFSLGTVHEATKIPLDVLRAIEEGYTVRTLSSFYLKGFMKMYAKYLGVDIRQIVVPETKEQKSEPAAPSLPLKNQPELPEDWERLLNSESLRVAMNVGLALFVLFLIFRMSSCVHGKIKARDAGKPAVIDISVVKETEKSKPNSREAGVPQPQAALKDPKPAVSVVPSAQGKLSSPAPAAVQPTEKEVHLTVKAQASGWLQVKVDGNLVFRSSLATGAVESWQADKEIELSGKGIYSLEYELNGKVLGPLGRTDRSARRVIFTKNGLEVNP